jgi:pSer/pThr/pTyr-binding forkhead associated (FHA) protein
MDTVEINIGSSGPQGHAIQNYDENLALNERGAFPNQDETSDNGTGNAPSFLEEEQMEPTKLCIMKGPAKGDKFDVGKTAMFIGRSSRNDIQIKDIKVSRKHLKVFRTERTLFVEDLRSTNGTRLNGKTIPPGQCFEMEKGDLITLGKSVIQFGEIFSNESSNTDNSSSSACGEDPDGKHNFLKERRSRSPKKLELEEIKRMFDQSLNINGMLEKLLESILDTLPRIARVAILVFNQKGKAKEVIARSRNEQNNKAVRYKRGLLGRLAKDGKAVKVSDTTYEAQTDDSENLGPMQTSSTLCVPIIANTKISGAIYLNSLPGPYEGFRKEDLQRLNSLTGFIALAIENSTFLTD